MYNAKKILAKEGVRKVGKHKKELTLIRDIKKVIDDKFTEEFHSNHPKSNGVLLEPILYKFNKHLGSVITSTREGVELPFLMGFMFTVSFKKNMNRVNIDMTEQEQVPVTYTNLETDGYQCRVMYITCKSGAKFKNIKYWGFDLSKEFKKDLSIAYPKNWKIFPVVNNPLFSSTLVTTSAQLRKMENTNKERVKVYNPLKWD